MAVFKAENVEDLYEIGEVLGSGHFGQVKRVSERSTGISWAGKFLKIRRKGCSPLGMDRASVEHEVEILQALKHPNIVMLKDVFESRSEVVLVLELISGGELFDFIAEKDNLLEIEAIEFMKQILQGLKFMHHSNIAHFDLKPENIMLSNKVTPHPNIKLIDFGLAHHFVPGQEYKSTSGTPQYVAPEVISFEPLSTAADMWSIGVITYILLSGMSPFQGDTDEETLRNVVAMKYEFEDLYFKTTSSMAKDFIQKLLVKDPRERMTADECLLHPWIKPITRKQVANRNRSSINMRSFKRFNAKRKWKMSFNMVFVCNRLANLRLLCKHRSNPDLLQRQCESDGEDSETNPSSLLRRRLSSSS
ncbi:death-associated protein kinase 2 [Oryzias melastigma]|uniref:non-specific serine/threonine protein kinase n=1 Tax=Oryzias melastigma TaxID=30732 RepID=A0A3B3DU88_ORYME|nr:death-associated protein kinase 2 [Oryzias melastigma]XP_024116302.1 death-associated protein kinase 2 [Oryzias melastigma]XP_024116310.1 death-associated protein kinase 2 [Oryzias melastigma]